jgi:hypothetical protein
MAGCGSSTYPVSGVLTDESGQPLKELAGFSVTFTSEQLGRSSRGEIQPDGTFRMGTRKSNDGVYPGEYKVTLSQPHPNVERRDNRQPVVDQSYENPEQTDLTAKVAPKDNTFTFRLRRLTP